jgi:hypothetical protein
VVFNFNAFPIQSQLFFFLLQGVELSNIVTETVSDDHPIIGAIGKLKNPATQKVEIEEQCNILAAQCSKGSLLI